MKKLKRLIKGALMASAVVRVCVDAYKAAKVEADAAVSEAMDRPASKDTIDAIGVLGPLGFTEAELREASKKLDELTKDLPTFDIETMEVVDECTGEAHQLEVVKVDGKVLIMDGDGQVN